MKKIKIGVFTDVFSKLFRIKKTEAFASVSMLLIVFGLLLK